MLMIRENETYRIISDNQATCTVGLSEDEFKVLYDSVSIDSYSLATKDTTVI